MDTLEWTEKYRSKALVRFMKRVEITSSDGECWRWTGGLTKYGYGRFCIKNHDRHAHRVAYVLLIGPLVEGLCIDHICRNRACVNPAHLRQVTRAINNVENSLSIAAKLKAATACKHGHPYEDGSYYMKKASQYNGKRYRRCKKCDSRDNRSGYLKRKSKVRFS